jgi:hypothetical protein
MALAAAWTPLPHFLKNIQKLIAHNARVYATFLRGE